MSLLGRAALAMWWEVTPELLGDFEHWHTHEHLAERLGIPGFRRGTRWTDASGGEGVFQMYELEAHEVLSSPHYLARLNAPTPWSTQMMPLHRNMVRSQCHVLESRGGGVARQVLTLRLSPVEGGQEMLRAALKAAFAQWVQRPGLIGAHLLRHEAPAIARTTEQKMRGSADRYADWVVVVHGYAAQALQALSEGELSDAALQRVGAAPGVMAGRYALSCSVTPQDVP